MDDVNAPTQVGCLIAKGATAEIYAWGSDRILKLYNAGFPPEDAQYEQRVSALIYHTLHLGPAVYETVRYQGRNGIVFERLHGATMLQKLMRRPMQYRHFTQELAAMQKKMHTCQAEGLLSPIAGRIRHNVLRTGLLTGSDKEALLGALEKLPQGQALCHFDFHPDNVFYTGDKPVAIDWMTAGYGNLLLDVARTSMLLRYASPPNMSPLLRLALSLFQRLMAASYERCYLGKARAARRMLAIYRLPVYAARLAELEGMRGNDASRKIEANRLLRYIRNHLPHEQPTP